MPKVKALGIYAERDINFIRAIEAGMKRQGIDYRAVTKAVGISTKTHYNRLQEPAGMKLQELRGYIRACKIPPEDVLSALYDAKELEKYERRK